MLQVGTIDVVIYAKEHWPNTTFALTLGALCVLLVCWGWGLGPLPFRTVDCVLEWRWLGTAI